MKKTTRLNYATRFERRIPRPRSRFRRDAFGRVLLEHTLILWAIVLRVVLMFRILPRIPALSQNVLDALLGDLDLFEEDMSAHIRNKMLEGTWIRDRSSSMGNTAPLVEVSSKPSGYIVK